MEEQLLMEMSKRPVGVWIIFVFVILSTLLFLSSFVYMWVEVPGVLVHFPKMPIIFLITLTIGNLVGAIILFQLRVLAFWVFIGTNVIGSILAVVYLLFGENTTIIDFDISSSQWLGLFAWITILIYVWKLKSQGILT